MTYDAMIDLETLATDHDAIVASIGIVLMDMQGLRVVDCYTFHEVLNWDDQFKRGRKCDPSTVRWWLQQSDEARKALIAPTPAFANMKYLNENLRRFLSDVDCVWGNGADFDCAIMQSLYKTYEIPCPWSFHKHRCFRTLKNMSRVEPPERVGTHHNALDDAVFQARWLMEILRAEGQAA